MVTKSPINTVFDRMVTLSRAMDEAFAQEKNGSAPRVARHYWTPSLDAWETESAFVVQLDLPGLSAENVDLSFDRNVLTIQGTRPSPAPALEKNELKVFFAERVHGSFTRSLRFPADVESDRIHAAFENGVLTITVPKAEKAKPRKISIQSGMSA